MGVVGLGLGSLGVWELGYVLYITSIVALGLVLRASPDGWDMKGSIARRKIKLVSFQSGLTENSGSLLHWLPPMSFVSFMAPMIEFEQSSVSMRAAPM